MFKSIAHFFSYIVSHFNEAFMPEQTNISPQAQIIPAACKTEISALHEPEFQDTSAEKLSHLTIQRKLIVGAAGDPLEYEADAMADRVMHKSAPSFLQKKARYKTIRRKNSCENPSVLSFKKKRQKVRMQ